MLRTLVLFCSYTALVVPSSAPRGQTAAGAQGPHLAVVNQKEHRILFVDPATGKIDAAVSVGVNGHEIAASADGKALFVPIYGDSGVGRPGTDGQEIDVIDVPTRTLSRKIRFSRPLRPHKDVFGPDGLLYVTGELADAVEVVDPRGVVLAEIPTGAKESHMLAITRDGKRGFTANVGAGSVSVLDLARRKTLQVIKVADRIQRIALSNDERWAFTSDQDSPRVAVLDLEAGKVGRWLKTTGQPYVTQPTADGKYLIVAETTAGKGQLEVFSLSDWSLVHTIPMVASQTGAFLLHGGLVYLSVPAGGTIERIDPTSWTRLPPLVLTAGVDGMAWVD